MKKVPFFIYIDFIMLSCMGVFRGLTAFDFENREKTGFELQAGEIAA